MATASRDTPLWSPSEEAIARANLTRYERWLDDRRGLRFDSYAELWDWSGRDLGGFWSSIGDFCDVQASQPYDRVLGSREMPGTEWFPGARLNYAEHAFRGKRDDAVAIRHASELRELGARTWG